MLVKELTRCVYVAKTPEMEDYMVAKSWFVTCIGDVSAPPSSAAAETVIHRTNVHAASVLSPYSKLHFFPGLPLRTIAWTVSSELLGFCFYFSPYFFASVPCARLSWPSRQLFSTRWYTVPYRIVFTSFPSEGVLMCGGAKGSGLRSRGSGFNSRSRSGCVPTLDKLFTEEHPMQKIVSDQIVVFWGKSKGMRSSCDGV